MGFGIAIPAGKCPRVRQGRPDAGKPWTEVDPAVVAGWLEKAADKMSDNDREWAVYCLTREQAKKARAKDVVVEAEVGQ